MLEELDNVVKDLVLTALNDNNKVAIVTNATLEWVYQSSQTLLPQTAAAMQGKVHVITARVDGLSLR